MVDIWQAIGHVFGLDNLSGPFYGWWSGAGSDISEIALPVALLTWYRTHTCHVDTCWHFGRHKVDGTPYTVCKKHHPGVPDKVTHEHIIVAHREATCQQTADESSDSRSNSAG